MYGTNAGDQISGSTRSDPLDLNGDGLKDFVSTSLDASADGISGDFGVVTVLITDQCTADTGKTVPGVCGCGTADTDSDASGI